MNALIEMSKEAKRLGYIKGESAKAWAKRDAQSAKQFAAFVAANSGRIAKQIATVLA